MDETAAKLRMERDSVPEELDGRTVAERCGRRIER